MKILTKKVIIILTGTRLIPLVTIIKANTKILLKHKNLKMIINDILSTTTINQLRTFKKIPVKRKQILKINSLNLNLLIINQIYMISFILEKGLRLYKTIPPMLFTLLVLTSLKKNLMT